jgi:hypothetical protein
MELLVAHMMGDYFIQNTWMATNKAKHWFPCLIHCFLYALSVMAICRWCDWRLAVVFLTHYFMDRYRLASYWRKWFSGDQELPWIITADNTVHLLILWLLRW